VNSCMCLCTLDDSTVIIVLCIIIFFNQVKNPVGSKIAEVNYKICLAGRHIIFIIIIIITSTTITFIISCIPVGYILCFRHVFWQSLAQTYESMNDRWRALGYRKAITALKKHKRPITSFEVRKVDSSQ